MRVRYRRRVRGDERRRLPNPLTVGTASMRRQRSAVVAIAVSLTFAASAHAQQVIEIDYDAGRTIIDDEWRSMGSLVLAVDEARAILYMNDAEEPHGVMAFSMETGEWVRTIATPEGDGPHEFSQGRTGMTIAPGGGLYVAGLVRVVEFSSLGEPLATWRPVVPTSKHVCALGGQPAVPTQNGVVRRSDDIADERIGSRVTDGHAIIAATVDEARTAGDLLWSSRIACTADRAFVVMSYDVGPDTVFAYSRRGEEAGVPVPTVFTDRGAGCVKRTRSMYGAVIREEPCPGWNEDLYPSLDRLDNLVLASRDHRTPGAVIDPRTGCHTVLRAPRADAAYRFARIYCDSALVFTHDGRRETRGERTVLVVDPGATKVTLHPLRRISGDPCIGMLPTVN